MKNDRSAEEVFANVPILDGSLEHCGGGTHRITSRGADKESYLDYLQVLEGEGFVKCADNSEGIEGTNFNATYARDNQVVTVCYVERLNIIYISGSMKR